MPIFTYTGIGFRVSESNSIGARTFKRDGIGYGRGACGWGEQADFSAGNPSRVAGKLRWPL